MELLALGRRPCSRKEMRQDRDHRFCHRFSVQHVHRTHRKIGQTSLVCKPQPHGTATETRAGHVGVADPTLVDRGQARWMGLQMGVGQDGVAVVCNNMWKWRMVMIFTIQRFDYGRDCCFREER